MRTAEGEGWRRKTKIEAHAFVAQARSDFAVDAPKRKLQKFAGWFSRVARKSAAVSLVGGEYINRVVVPSSLVSSLPPPDQTDPAWRTLTSVSSTSSASLSPLLLTFSRHALL